MTAVAGGLAVAIAERLIDADTVADNITPDARGSLSGLAGTALLHARLSAVDDRFATSAIAHWKRAAAYSRDSGITGGGTFSGPGAMAASLILGSPYLPDPQPLHDQCSAAARWLSAYAVAIADQHQDRIRSGGAPSSWAVYDTICGLAGIGRVLLAAAENGHGQARPGLDAALSVLTAMTTNRIGSRPGWWMPADAYPATTYVHPSGAAATGTAHGIAGPLALLATALIAGYTVPGQDTAIRTAADWLLHWRDPTTGTWPPLISGDDLQHGIAAPVAGRRDAWCYGTPGISTALTQTTWALDDATYRVAADHAMLTLAARDSRSWDVEGPTLCHGYAGVLQTSRRDPDLARHVAAQIDRACSPGRRYLIQHSDRGTVTDDPGLLTGAAGVALALADHAGLPPSLPPTRWDAILLLS